MVHPKKALYFDGPCLAHRTEGREIIRKARQFNRLQKSGAETDCVI